MAISSLAPLARGRQLVNEGRARVVREALGLSAADVAALVGCSGSAVFMWERGERRPSGDVGRRYCELIYEMAASEVPLLVAGAPVREGAAR